MTVLDTTARRLLIYGIGNPGRQDDAVGVLAVEQLAEAGVREGVTLESGYQLAPEDAWVLSQHDAVIFVDATAAPHALGPYTVHPISAASTPSITTHEMSMESVLALCRSIYGRMPDASVIAVPAYGFEVNAPLTPLAASHLATLVRDLRAELAP